MEPKQKKEKVLVVKMDTIACRKIGFSIEFIVGLTAIFFEDKIQKKEETAERKDTEEKDVTEEQKKDKNR